MDVQTSSGILGIAGCLFLVLGIIRLRRGRLLRAATPLTFALALFAGAGLFFAIGANLYTYARLVDERPVATLYFELNAPNLYTATLTYADGRAPESFELAGNEWQIDARVIKWAGWANLLGMDAHYRLDRLSGRYLWVADELNQPRTVYDLAYDNPGLDLWELGQRYSDWLPWRDAMYGSAAYLPMAHAAEYQVRITQTGLIARPSNAAARELLERWGPRLPE